MNIMKQQRNNYLTLALIGGVLISGSAIAGGSHTGPFGFTPIYRSATLDAHYDREAPWVIPYGFEQVLVSGETSDQWGGEGLNIYDRGTNASDWHDMNTVNENGPHAGRFLFRTHEVRLRSGNKPDDVYPKGGAISLVDLKTGQHMVIAQNSSYNALDGIRWTPWGTLLFAEETTGGRLFEMVFSRDPETKLPTSATIYDRMQVGRLAHEGIDVDEEGNIYVVDEFRGQKEGVGGGVYKFVPDVYGDLSRGKLYVLKVESSDEEALGQAEWAGPIDPANARQSGTDAGGSTYNRPEDVEIIGNTLYVAVTEGTYSNGIQNYDGRVLAVNLDSMVVTDFIKPGLNVPDEDIDPNAGLDNPDNLGQTPDGKLMVIEDNKPSDIWIAQDDNQDGVADSVWLFASLKDPSAEGTGIYFGKDAHTLLVNVQHATDQDGDGTWAIRKIAKSNNKK